MNRDLIKTIAGILLVGLIVVATYLYGNHQSQLQQQKDQASRQSQQQVAQNTTPAKPTPTPAKPAPAPVAAPQPQPTSMPQTGASTPLPQTGGLSSVMPALALVGGVELYRRSRRSLQRAALEV